MRAQDESPRATRGVFVIRWAHRGYKRLVSPLLGNVCRFEPSCSDYALASVDRHGWIRGGALAIRRILRCHPWNPGGSDPVP